VSLTFISVYLNEIVSFAAADLSSKTASNNNLRKPGKKAT
jgi:hypothetical protein